MFQRRKDRELLALIEDGKKIGYPVEGMAEALGISQKITDAQRRQAERAAKKKH